MTAPEPVADIFRAAVEYSRDTRDRIAADLCGVTFHCPERPWSEVIASRTKDGRGRLRQAALATLKLASEDARPYVRHALTELLNAVNALAVYTPEYQLQRDTMPAAIARRLVLSQGDLDFAVWVPTADGLKCLDGLRERVKVAYIHLEALFVSYDTPAARVLAVAKRVADVVLEPTEAKVMREWLTSLDHGDGVAG